MPYYFEVRIGQSQFDYSQLPGEELNFSICLHKINKNENKSMKFFKRLKFQNRFPNILLMNFVCV